MFYFPLDTFYKMDLLLTTIIQYNANLMFYYYFFYFMLEKTFV